MAAGIQSAADGPDKDGDKERVPLHLALAGTERADHGWVIGRRSGSGDTEGAIWRGNRRKPK